jgi:pyrroline-5-carboxylate reductase
MENCNITFIGGGNMAQSLIGGLISDGFKAENIHVADPNTDNLNMLSERFSVNTYHNNAEACQQGNVVILAVKPQQLQPVVNELALDWKSDQLLISIAAGIRLTDIARWLNADNAAIVRTMPNTPSLVQAGATALYANEHVTKA